MPTELQTDEQAAWKQRFRAPSLWGRAAPAAPDRGLVISNRSGIFQLYAWDVLSGDLRQLTDRPSGVIGGAIDAHGRYVYYLDDAQGNEIGHFVRVPFEGGEPQDVTPDLPLYSSWSISFSRSGSHVALNAATQGGYTVYVAPVDADGAIGAFTPVYTSRSLTYGPALSHDGDIVVVMSSERSGKPQFSLLAFDTGSGQQIGELWDGDDSSVEITIASRVPGDPRMIAVSNRSGTMRPLIWNPRTGERIDLDLDDLDGEIFAEDWSFDGDHLLLKQFDRAVQQLYRYDLRDGSLARLDHPGGTFSGGFWRPDGGIFTGWQNSMQPQQVVELDGRSGALRRVVLAAGTVPPGHAWRSISFASSDGQQIQGWLGLPDGDGPFPTILETHGGPSAVQTDTFHAASQSWLDHGFAFLSINYRGSTTFGKAFEQKIWNDLGHWEVVDLAAAHMWLVREGIARPDEIFLTGWSYGGYLTLMGLGKLPNLWAGGMAGIAIADWVTQYEDTAETLKGYQVALLGGTPDEVPERYAASSPITYADQVSAPVLVIQGSNDTRCPSRPMRLYEAKMKQLGKDISIHWFEAGHGSYAVEQSIRHQELMLRFVYGLLG